MDGSYDGDDRVRFAASISHRLHALEHLPFGVSSTPRAAQLPVPVVIDRAEAARLFDIDGNSYIDYALGYGPLILGHSPRPVLDALHAELARGLRTASVHRGEAELADLISTCVPVAEQTTFVSSGTEAVQLALKVARAKTGRTKIVKFRANYHGWFDSVDVAGGFDRDNVATLGQDPSAASSVTVLDWGNADSVESTLNSSFAAVIVEPAAINAGCFEPPVGFLERLRTITRRHGVVLIFDEVITGFRLALGGAQEAYGVIPDLCVLGKALGAGLPLSAVAGTREMMAPIASGRLAHRGTFNGNPLAVAAGIACVQYLRAGRAEIYPRLHRFATEIREHVNAEAAGTGNAVFAKQAGPSLQIFAGVRGMETFNDIAKADRPKTLALTGALLRQGVFVMPRGLMYLSTAHTADDIAVTKAAMTSVLDGLAARG